MDSIKVNSWAPYPKILIFIFPTVKHGWGRIQRINSSLGDFIIWFLDQKVIFQFFTLKAYIHTSKRMGLPQLASKKKWCPYCKTQDALLHDIMTLSSCQSTHWSAATIAVPTTTTTTTPPPPPPPTTTTTILLMVQPHKRNDSSYCSPASRSGRFEAVFPTA